MAAFLRGAGLETVALPDPVQTMEQLGAAFRAMVSGIRNTLIARSEVKREFRIEATVIRRRGNNLLKFSADDDDALLALLGAGRHVEMGAAEAIGDALRDMRLHEIATVAAIRSAVRALFARFDPVKLNLAAEQSGDDAPRSFADQSFVIAMHEKEDHLARQRLHTFPDALGSSHQIANRCASDVPGRCGRAHPGRRTRRASQGRKEQKGGAGHQGFDHAAVSGNQFQQRE